MESQQVDDIEFVICKLTKYSSHDDIIMALCERNGYRWEEAANFVRRVEVEHSYRIWVRQRPWLILAGVLMSVNGLVVMTLSMDSWLSGELVPLTLTLWVIEFDLPNGGQFVELLIGAAALLGGIAGLLLVVQKERKEK